MRTLYISGTSMTRKLVPSTSPYAPIIGFSRAVRVGNHISVGGTAPIDANGKTVGVGDPAAQTRQCLETIKAALEQAGASLSDVVRTRMLLTRIDDWQQIAKVRGEYFKDIRPVDTVMEVKGFINKEWLIEIEVDAVVDER
jgi:enamine deaminase RidA (YjgF/YER057c/UK114 family)